MNGWQLAFLALAIPVVSSLAGLGVGFAVGTARDWSEDEGGSRAIGMMIVAAFFAAAAGALYVTRLGYGALA